jgi:hypothetical protein
MWHGQLTNHHIKRSGLKRALLITAPFHNLIFSAIIPLGGPRFLMFRPSCPALRIGTSRRDIGPVDPVPLPEQLYLPPCFFLLETSQANFAVSLCSEGKSYTLCRLSFLFVLLVKVQIQNHKSSISLIWIPRLTGISTSLPRLGEPLKLVLPPLDSNKTKLKISHLLFVLCCVLYII